jgi:hypothetical protein
MVWEVGSSVKAADVSPSRRAVQSSDLFSAMAFCHQADILSA